MFNIGWSEYLVIAVIALIAIGPKELPGVLRMVGQWVAKARKMAAEFQGQFQEAMREAEMADLKKSFDEVKEAATGFASGDVMTSLHKDVTSALSIDDKPAPADASSSPETVNPATEAAASEPLAIAPVNEPAPATPEAHPAVVETAEPERDAKAS
ncbi:Sec-independent protein translocase protein TatB [Bradyrhizobium sp.]|jgi:sec-independent protein translocase protein TatB|uniref:Sec-independent protein translocase protein TatB n=1 Tax=Bradyrhizobium sp. TaxID=376 RepID=UPI002D3441B8|nr:Sec-independent protein translocase protein TatB [Bradyrhizobium sp.]HZR77190.1 Sec-independent protein translocase protein TatB [Bradyrhizobium sp.]